MFLDGSRMAKSKDAAIKRHKDQQGLQNAVDTLGIDGLNVEWRRSIRGVNKYVLIHKNNAVSGLLNYEAMKHYIGGMLLSKELLNK